MRRIIVGSLALLFVLIVVAIAQIGAYDIPPEEVARRCDKAQPAWQSYPEDIKGQIGARPVALWRGEVVHARQEGGSVSILFRIEEPWAGWEAAMPVLMRAPTGAVSLGVAEDRVSSERRYQFALPENDVAPLPWVEVQYPHAQIRITLDAQGEWRKFP